jgi:hypothetical protein
MPFQKSVIVCPSAKAQVSVQLPRYSAPVLSMVMAAWKVLVLVDEAV